MESLLSTALEHVVRALAAAAAAMALAGAISVHVARAGDVHVAKAGVLVKMLPVPPTATGADQLQQAKLFCDFCCYATSS